MSYYQNRQTMSSTDENGQTRPFPGRTITRATASPDGQYVAAVVSASEIHVVGYSGKRSRTIYHVATIPSRQVQKVLAHASTLSWSPEIYSSDTNGKAEIVLDADDHFIRVWLLLSDGQRLVVVCAAMDSRCSSEGPCTILADYDLGSQLANFSYVGFAFNHEYAIVIQNLGIQASIISLTRLERHDIMNIKYPDSRGLAMSSDSRCFCIIARTEGQDFIIVFFATELGAFKQNTFCSQTHDAQGIKWCPNSDPLLCIWDSAAYGLKVSFFTANGHHLKHMDMTSASLNLPLTYPGYEGIGANSVDWFSCGSKVILSVFDDSGHLFIQHRSGSGHEQLRPLNTTIKHPDVVDCTTYNVWQESLLGVHSFSLLNASFHPRHVNRFAGTDQMAMNANCDLIATKDSSRPWTLWIWDVLVPQPLAVVNFRDRIKQLLWHPTVPEILVIVTNQKKPVLYVWDATFQELFIVAEWVARDEVETSNWEAKWLSNEFKEAPTLLLSSPREYDAGILNVDRDGATFQSAIEQDQARRSNGS